MNAAPLESRSRAADDVHALALPCTFGRYTLFDRVGKGGMAQIFLARAESALGATRLAVVKRILPAFAADPRFSAMLVHEAKLAAVLNHRHIVQVFDLERADDELFIAMEYVEGFDLNTLLRSCTERKVGLPAPHALGIVADVLEGLDYAHRRVDESGAPLGIVHRDVSPSNVLISYDGEVKLCDFGIAHANDVVREGAGDALKGKAGYMSPEHARGEALDARADVFAAGIILWELLAGRRLYRPKGDATLLEQAQQAQIPPLPDKGLPEHDRLAAIVSKALATSASDRHASAGEFGRELEAYLADTGLIASRLKLGEWIEATFGTAILDQRRESERKLPVSRIEALRPSATSVTPRASGRVRVGTYAASQTRIPAPPPMPEDLGPGVLLHPEPEAPAQHTEIMVDVDLGPEVPVVPAPAGSLVASSFDVERPSEPLELSAPISVATRKRSQRMMVTLGVAIFVLIALATFLGSR